MCLLGIVILLADKMVLHSLWGTFNVPHIATLLCLKQFFHDLFQRHTDLGAG
jgi:hypothetical protein